jgi:hypothetical protein
MTTEERMNRLESKMDKLLSLVSKHERLEEMESRVNGMIEKFSEENDQPEVKDEIRARKITVVDMDGKNRIALQGSSLTMFDEKNIERLEIAVIPSRTSLNIKDPKGLDRISLYTEQGLPLIPSEEAAGIWLSNKTKGYLVEMRTDNKSASVGCRTVNDKCNEVAMGVDDMDSTISVSSHYGTGCIIVKETHLGDDDEVVWKAP